MSNFGNIRINLPNRPHTHESFHTAVKRMMGGLC
jgi:hypothetical protein